MPKKTIVGALVVTYLRGGKTTYRLVDEQTYRNALKNLDSARKQVERAAYLLPSVERDARELSNAAFVKKYKASSVELLSQLRNPVGISTLVLWRIEVEPIFKGTFLRHQGSFKVNFAEVKSLAFKDRCFVDDV